ncbi:MAG: LacI family DNA-binding transcriptional regulator [Natronospirillum sp.]
MSKRPTIQDLAQAAGVSLATVDRVLNNRQRVKESTAHRVMLAAEDIGYYAAGLIKHRIKASKPQYRLHFLLQKEEEVFYLQLSEALQTAVGDHPDMQGSARVDFVGEINPRTIAQRLREAAEHADALGIVAINHPLVAEAIDEVAAQGVPVFCLVTDVVAPGRAGYVGPDNHKRGRTAAWAVSRLSRSPGKVAIMLGTHRYQSQEISEISFRSYLREYAPEFQVLESVLNLDENRLAYEAAVSLLTSNPELVAIFSAGGGMEGLVQAVRDEGRDQDLVLVCNELTPFSRGALRDHTIDLLVATPIARLATAAVDAMIEAIVQPTNLGMREIALPVDLYLAENI